MRRHPRMARTDPTAPSGWATCQKSGFVGNAKNLHMQTEWRGLKIMPTGILAYARYIDKPQRQLGANILAPDPVGLANARPEQYAVDENWPRLLQRGQPRYLQGPTRVARMLQYSVYFETQTDY
jgi:hypothetical protein